MTTTFLVQNSSVMALRKTNNVFGRFSSLPPKISPSRNAHSIFIVVSPSLKNPAAQQWKSARKIVVPMIVPAVGGF